MPSHTAPTSHLNDPVTQHMRTDPARVRVDQTVGEAIAASRAAPPEGRIIYFYAIDDQGRLAGVVPTRRLLLSDDATPIRNVMVPKVVTIPASATVLEACEFFLLHRLLAFPIGSAQQGLTKLLGLEFQLEAIDYAAANFVHADLSPKEFDEAMAKRGESWWSMFMKLMKESMARANTQKSRTPDVGMGDLFGILFGSDREVRLRRIMAEQFTDMDVLTAAFGGEDGSTLITDRNAAAVDVLRDQIARGHRRIAIFYGAAHMDDFDRRLRQDFGLQPGETIWLEAWDLRDSAVRNR
jgi:CBS domain-containing protein